MLSVLFSYLRGVGQGLLSGVSKVTRPSTKTDSRTPGAKAFGGSKKQGTPKFVQRSNNYNVDTELILVMVRA
jgi:hypothetical protein